MTRASRATRRARVYRVTDPNPSVAILPILKQHMGESIVLVVYRKGKARTRGTIKGGRDHGEKFALRHKYDVPDTNNEVNRAFKKGKHLEGWFWNWRTGSDEPHCFHLQPGDEIRVFTAEQLQPRRHAQAMASGVSHCVFEPMRAWAHHEMAVYHAKEFLEAKGSKKRNAMQKEKSKFKRYAIACEHLAETFRAGVPDDCFQEVVDALPIATRIIVALPFVKQNMIDVRSKGCCRVFRFTNTRIDHVEMEKVELNEVTLDDKAEEGAFECSIEELEEKVAELIESETFFHFKKGPKGVRQVSTLEGTYRVDSEFSRTVREFEKETGLDKMKVCAIRQPVLTEMLQRGMHYNLPGVRNGKLPPLLQEMVDAEREVRRLLANKEMVLQFDDVKIPTDAEIEAAQHTAMAKRAEASDEFTCMDIMKSYASFHKCHLYEQEKFPSKFTETVKTDRLRGPGVYLVEAFDWSDADAHLLAECDKLGKPYRDMNQYTRPDLVYLQERGVRFTILEGAWAGGHQPHFDFRFSGEPRTETTEATGMYQKDENGAAFYAKWEGLCNSVNHNDEMWLHGSRKYFENLLSYLPEGSKMQYYDDELQSARLMFPKSSCTHLTHITAYGNAYERIIMLEQLRKMDLDSIVSIDKDGICAKQHDFDYDADIWCEKDLPSFRNEQVDCYVSNLWQVDQVDDALTPLCGDMPCRDLAGCSFHVGPGGGGKTHNNLIDQGLCAPVFVPPSYELLESKQNEYTVSGMVLAVALGQNEEKWRRIEVYHSVIIWDECSMWNEGTLRAALQRFPYHKHIFCGDIGYQLPPTKNATTPTDAVALTMEYVRKQGIPIIKYDHSYRIKEEALREICNTLRYMIENGRTPDQQKAYVLKKLRPLGQVLTTVDACVSAFDIHDSILASTHEQCAQYTEQLQKREFLVDGKRVRKFRVGKNAPLPNGRIVIGPEAPCKQSSEAYASTIHAFQGQAVQNKLFIDARRMFDITHWYTAISRAQYLTGQIYVIDPPPPPPSEIYAKTLMYILRSRNGPLVYVGFTTVSLQKRFERHKADYKATDGRRVCTSVQVLAQGDCYIEQLEAWPCASVQDAKAREIYWIERTPHTVNRSIERPTDDVAAVCAAPCAPIEVIQHPTASVSVATNDEDFMVNLRESMVADEPASKLSELYTRKRPAPSQPRLMMDLKRLKELRGD